VTPERVLSEYNEDLILNFFEALRKRKEILNNDLAAAELKRSSNTKAWLKKSRKKAFKCDVRLKFSLISS